MARTWLTSGRTLLLPAPTWLETLQKSPLPALT
jgi:hypothetical protein